ncbi:MAG: amidohydrolase family protein [Actinomycetota bacterium]|nr:amidohydrolase family protein [Actinomycetota bacterium]MED6304193.1 amidohydrolase family protein [Actinomycetota bacterium]
MPYVEDRVIHDADSHTMEPPEWLDEFASREVREYAHENFSINENTPIFREIDQCRSLHEDPDFRSAAEAEIMLRKNYRAHGAWNPMDRSEALDHMGFASQLIFPTMPNTLLEAMEHDAPPNLTYETASAANRAQISFCENDVRLLPVAYIPLQDLDRAAPCAAEAIEAGASALLIPNRMPKGHAHSHIAFDDVWGQAQEAGIPIVMHVATPELVMPPQHRNNGLPPELDFHGGSENFRSVSYMAISAAPVQALSMLVFDGVLERFPELKLGVIELGAAWLPSFMRQLEAAFDAFERHEQRLQKLSLRPSDYVRRQVRVTPFPTEPTKWIIQNTGKEICMFSSDFPHVEGGRNPLRRFDTEVANLSGEVQDRFFRRNFEDLMGRGMSKLISTQG